MQDAGVANLLFFLFISLPLFIVLPVWSMLRILKRAGYSGWWVVAMFIPLLNVVMIWIFAFSEWPRYRESVEL